MGESLSVALLEAAGYRVLSDEGRAYRPFAQLRLASTAQIEDAVRSSEFDGGSGVDFDRESGDGI
ncbi:MAG: hypothetical protein WC846_04210 [Candidatus Gracilibacteria bacterium]|jgi:hypothetical protein